MHSLTVDGPDRLLSWRRVREFAVPASMIETATARREAGDWAGACAAAHVDVDLDLRAVSSGYGRELVHAVRHDLRRLAPDLLRWHLPRTTADGLLRPGLSMSLARYPAGEHDVHLVARTAPGWASAGQRISLGLWDPALPDTGPHPRPRPDRRFRLDLHPHLWAADRAAELGERCGPPDRAGSSPPGRTGSRPGWWDRIPAGQGYAAHRWVAEAALLRLADGHHGAVAVRLGRGRRLLLTGDDGVLVRGGNGVPILPYAATWIPPDLELLRTGTITADRLHPLVASALTADGDGHRLGAPAVPHHQAEVRLVDCGGAAHRLALVDGRLTPLDHDAAELEREALLIALGGPPLPCLRAVDRATRRPECLDEVRTRLGHGDRAGATAMVTGLLGPGIEPEGELRAALTDADEGRIEHGLYRAGLSSRAPFGITGLAGPRMDRAGRRGRHHRLPKRAAPVR